MLTEETNPRSADKKQEGTSNIPWEPIYRSITSKRLWPTETTIRGLNLELLRQEGITAVLDAGCGDGKNLAWLVEQGFWGIGVDASLAALQKCTNYLDQQNLKGRYLILSSQQLEFLPFIDGALSAAICIDVLSHTKKPKNILLELARILRTGGLLYVNLFHPDDSCRLGPRMRKGQRTGEYWYTPSVVSPAEREREYYYRFYMKEEVSALLESTPFEFLSLERREWSEPPHEVYREEEHEHVSWFALLRRI